MYGSLEKTKLKRQNYKKCLKVFSYVLQKKLFLLGCGVCFTSLSMYPGCGNLNYIKDGARDTLHKRMLLVVLCLGDLTAYAMTYFSFMEEEPF